MVPLNKQSLLELLQRLDNEDPATGGTKWETKIDEFDFKMHIKPKGSELSHETPLIKAEMFLASSHSIERVMKAVHNKEDRLAWDKDLEYGETIKVVEGKLVLWY